MGTYQLAKVLAAVLLRGVVDKAGRPAIKHAIRVAARMETYGEATVAMLHDLVEDTQVTLDDLEALGYGWARPSDIADHLDEKATGYVLPDSLRSRYVHAQAILKGK
jgi:hypothetical protein